MATITMTGIKCEYKCAQCGIEYIEQRQPHENQFFTQCQKFGCSGEYKLINETEFTYEREIDEDNISEAPEPTE